VGLTFVYALSGLAVNHISDWDPNFTGYRREGRLASPLPEGAAAVAAALAQLGMRETPVEVFQGPDRLDIVLRERTLRITPSTRRVVEEGRRPRFLLRAANWLHLNRGKKAWTVLADAYAAGLLALATTGLFMLPGRQGLRGRGGLLVLLGAAVPILYVTLSGGPGAAPRGEPVEVRPAAVGAPAR
jgi:hypothetical protein